MMNVKAGNLINGMYVPLLVERNILLEGMVRFVRVLHKVCGACGNKYFIEDACPRPPGCGMEFDRNEMFHKAIRRLVFFPSTPQFSLVLVCKCTACENLFQITDQDLTDAVKHYGLRGIWKAQVNKASENAKVDNDLQGSDNFGVAHRIEETRIEESWGNAGAFCWCPRRNTNGHPQNELCLPASPTKVWLWQGTVEIPFQEWFEDLNAEEEQDE